MFKIIRKLRLCAYQNLQFNIKNIQNNYGTSHGYPVWGSDINCDFNDIWNVHSHQTY